MKMRKIAVLGAGRVGRAIIRDLVPQHIVKVFDVDEVALSDLADIPNVSSQAVDLLKTEYHKLLDGFDLVISAVPGDMGYTTLEQIIQTGINVVDISFFPEDAMGLDDKAKSKGVCAVVDCGVAPGMGNIILGRYNEIMTIDSYECLVGGLPLERSWPYQYKAGFSPIDVIEEYIRPARYVQHGKLVVREALSDPELVHFKGIGTLEAFNTDGLRTLLHTMRIPNMIEKTLRYPGTIEYLKVLRESGFFSQELIKVKDQLIRPIDLTSRLLFPLWELKKTDPDLTVMRITINGVMDGKEAQFEINLLDRHDMDSGISSMARTTGYTCTAVANLILKGSFYQSGIIPPEYIGRKEEHLNFIQDYLDARGVIYHRIQKQP